jgi:hypothetical protein
MRNCEICNNQFIPISVTGQEQKYCSKYCRNKAGNNRRIEKIKNEVISINQNRFNDNNEEMQEQIIELKNDVERLKELLIISFKNTNTLTESTLRLTDKVQDILNN